MDLFRDSLPTPQVCESFFKSFLGFSLAQAGPFDGVLAFPDPLLSRDPVALDTLAINELERERRALNAPEFKPNLALYTNAALLQLGVNDPAKIQAEKIR